MRFIILFLLLMNSLWAESVKSLTGNIVLDINNDGTSEVHLNSLGLAIGTGLSPSANLHLQGNGIITNDLVVGATAGNSTLEVAGSIGFGVQTVSTNVTLAGNSMVMVDTSSGNITVTLPSASSCAGRSYIIKKTATAYTLRLSASSNIDSGGPFDYSGNLVYLKVVSNGTQWYFLTESQAGDAPVAWTPSLLGTAPKLWVDASDASSMTITNTNDIDEWRSQDSITAKLTQSTVADKPHIITAGLNGLDTVDLDGSNHYFVGDGLSTAVDEFSFLAVRKHETGTASEAQIIGSANFQWQTGVAQLIYWGNAAKMSINVAQAASGDSFSNFPVGWNINSYVDASDGTSTSMLCFQNGSAAGDAKSGDDKNLDPYWIGASHTELTLDASRHLKTEFAEILIFNIALSTEDRQKIEGYLAHKWGLDGNLDSGHPYKSSPPYQ